MNNGYFQTTTISHSLKITTQLKKALTILVTPTEELYSFMQKELEDNPLYELPHKEIPCLPLKEGFFADKQEPLLDNLINQAKIAFSKEEFKIAEFILGSINAKGFLDESLSFLANQCQTTEEKIEQVRTKIFQFSPLGIASKNTQEFLLIQLKEKKTPSPLAYSIVKRHYLDLLKQNLSKIAKIEKVSKAQVQGEIEKKIRPLQVSPLHSSNSPYYGKEDIEVLESNGQLKILIKDEEVYPVSLAKHYEKLFISNQIKGEEKNFLLRALSQGNWLIKNLKMRHQTLYEITKILLNTQKEFFLEGTKISPLSLEEVAIQLGLSKSTISRSVQNKSIKTPFGQLPLKRFFLHKQSKERDPILKKLKFLIENESKSSPLTDAELCKKLQENGIKLSRRCITKYRLKLNILSSKKRKKHS